MFRFYRQFISTFFVLESEISLDTFLNDKETAKHLYDYYYMQLQILCWGHGTYTSHRYFQKQSRARIPVATSCFCEISKKKLLPKMGAQVSCFFLNPPPPLFHRVSGTAIDDVLRRSLFLLHFLFEILPSPYIVKINNLYEFNSVMIISIENTYKINP